MVQLLDTDVSRSAPGLHLHPLTPVADPSPVIRVPDVVEWRCSGNKLHPTQKPFRVLTPLTQWFSLPGDVILDPFCGSGSTLLAAREQRGRFIGIELDPRYHAIANE